MLTTVSHKYFNTIHDSSVFIDHNEAKIYEDYDKRISDYDSLSTIRSISSTSDDTFIFGDVEQLKPHNKQNISRRKLVLKSKIPQCSLIKSNLFSFNGIILKITEYGCASIIDYSRPPRKLITRSCDNIRKNSIKLCTSCGTRKTPLWRDADDGTPLCNACGIRWKKYHIRCIRCWYIPRKDEAFSIDCPNCSE